MFLPVREGSVVGTAVPDGEDLVPGGGGGDLTIRQRFKSVRTYTLVVLGGLGGLGGGGGGGGLGVSSTGSLGGGGGGGEGPIDKT